MKNKISLSLLLGVLFSLGQVNANDEEYDTLALMAAMKDASWRLSYKRPTDLKDAQTLAAVVWKVNPEKLRTIIAVVDGAWERKKKGNVINACYR